MLTGSELRGGMSVRLAGELYLVVAASYHGGRGKMGGVTHAKLDNVWKEARLDNGATILVAPGERIRVDVQAGRYVERARTRSR